MQDLHDWSTFGSGQSRVSQRLLKTGLWAAHTRLGEADRTPGGLQLGDVAIAQSHHEHRRSGTNSIRAMLRGILVGDALTALPRDISGLLKVESFDLRGHDGSSIVLGRTEPCQSGVGVQRLPRDPPRIAASDLAQAECPQVLGTAYSLYREGHHKLGGP